MFVFGDFNVHHKDWLTFSGGTDSSGELCYNFSISNDLTQMVNFPTRIPGCDAHSPAFLDFFLSADASIFCTMVFPPLANSNHIVVSVLIDFTSNSQLDALLRDDHFRDVPWEDLLLPVNFVSRLELELMYISLIISIKSSLTYLYGFQLFVKLPYSREITFFVRTNRINLLNLK